MLAEAALGQHPTGYIQVVLGFARRKDAEGFRSWLRHNGGYADPLTSMSHLWWTAVRGKTVRIYGPVAVRGIQATVGMRAACNRGALSAVLFFKDPHLADLARSSALKAGLPAVRSASNWYYASTVPPDRLPTVEFSLGTQEDVDTDLADWESLLLTVDAAYAGLGPDPRDTDPAELPKVLRLVCEIS